MTTDFKASQNAAGFPRSNQIMVRAPIGTSVMTSISIAFVLAAAGCSANREMPKAEIALGDGRLVVEVAADDKAKRVGLMHRTTLADDAGMLFVFDGHSPACLWMKNTMIPLDVAFIDERGLVINIAQMEPNTEIHHCSAAAAKYALEVNRGWLHKRGVAPGAKVVISPRATERGLPRQT